MRRTLSHSSIRLRQLHSSDRLALRAGLLAVVFALATAGCNNIDSETQKAKPSDVEDFSDEFFEWPADPSHPVLSLEIESPEIEGRIHIELMPELAPISVAEIIKLAGEEYYDGTTFHRVIRGFMIQGGDPKSRDRDPTNDGQGRAKIRLMDEFGAAPFERSVVGIANTGHKDSNSSQFFILHQDSRYLDGRYTVIGRVVDGMEVVDEITQVATDKVGRWGPKDRPIENIVMKSVKLSGQIGALVAAGSVVLADANSDSNTETLDDATADASETPEVGFPQLPGRSAESEIAASN
ncbi:MAG: peptidylprolyl isomerase [Myxococcota bacterium]